MIGRLLTVRATDRLPTIKSSMALDSLPRFLLRQARFKELESTRLEVDSRRRTVAELSHK